MPPPEFFPPGSLAVVAVPLGNLGDVTFRAIEVLRAADRVAAEDTRTVGSMLAHFGISPRFISYHDWNESERAPALLARLSAGERVALVCEAGTPGISDPGFDLVRLARRQGIHVFPVPGPSAVIAFVSACGLPTNSFSFLGFPSSRQRQRQNLFRELADRAETLIFFESPRRIVDALADALEVFGDRECCLAREMTKRHEEFLFGSLSQVSADLRLRARVRGEICWGVRGADDKRPEEGLSIEAAVSSALEKALRPREAAREVARRCSVTAKQAYEAVLARKRGPES